MAENKETDKQVDVNFESHPPIEQDLSGISRLIRQTFLTFIDNVKIAEYAIGLKDITQVIACEPSDEESDDSESDDDIYGVVSFVKLNDEPGSDILKFLGSKFPSLVDLHKDKKHNLGLIINERYINIPAQIALPTLKHLSSHLKKEEFTHLIFFSKILVRHVTRDSELPNKKQMTSKKKSSASDESLIYSNPEEEIIFEGCDAHFDFDVSKHCDENASWSLSGDIKYIPHRRIMIVDYKKWPKIMENLEKELSQ